MHAFKQDTAESPREDLCQLRSYQDVQVITNQTHKKSGKVGYYSKTNLAAAFFQPLYLWGSLNWRLDFKCKPNLAQNTDVLVFKLLYQILIYVISHHYLIQFGIVYYMRPSHEPWSPTPCRLQHWGLNFTTSPWEIHTVLRPTNKCVA